MGNNIKAYFDGSCKDNPGEIGSWGFVICDPWIEKKEVMYGKRITNNLAEHTALNKLLKELKILDMTEVSIFGDSQLICNVVNRKWGWYKKEWKPHRKYSRLNKLAIESNRLLCNGNHTLEWVSREENVIADRLTKEAYTE